MKLIDATLTYEYGSREEKEKHMKKMKADGYIIKVEFDSPYIIAKYEK